MEAKIIKSKLHRDFTIIPNEIMRRKDLSLSAKGMFCYIQHLPDDWIVYKNKLSDDLGISIRQVSNAFDELESRGYLICADVIRKGIPQKEYIFYQYPYNEYPTTSQNATSQNELTDAQNATSQNVILLNTNINTLNTKDNKDIVQFKDELERSFDIIWEKLPRKQNKEAAKKKWMKLSKAELEELRHTIKNHLVHWENMVKAGEQEYIPLFSTFLNNKRWRDEIIQKEATKSFTPHRLAL